MHIDEDIIVMGEPTSDDWPLDDLVHVPHLEEREPEEASIGNVFHKEYRQTQVRAVCFNT